MYIRKKDRELFKNLDNNLLMPYDFDKFVNKQLIKNKLIIKNKNTYLCTNCQTTFEDNVKINEYCRCPQCKNLYKVRSIKLKNYEFKDDLAILDRYEDYFIVRTFRLITDYKNKKYSHYYFEYARIIYDNKFHLVEEIINDNVVGTLNGWWISFREYNNKNWRYFRSYKYYLPDCFIYYSFNIKEVLSDIKKLEYSMLWELVENVDYCNLIDLIINYNPSIEILTKMKLYNLALCPRAFINKKTFEERFMGLSKDYIPFIREYNLDIDELTILSYIKIKNINYIKKLIGCYFPELKEISKTANLITLLEKTDFNCNLVTEYKDYISIAKKLKLNLKDKNILYPKNIKSAHDKALNDYKQVKDNILNNSIKSKYAKLKKNTFQDKKFIIFPAKDFDSLIDESSQQNNCVRTYAERIAKGECEIYFMRLVKDMKHSLATIEVKNKKVVQKRTKNNEMTTKSQDNFLKLWEQKVLQK